jgi:radical SAM protein with 4Fe4S-binding SPASM domain
MIQSFTKPVNLFFACYSYLKSSVTKANSVIGMPVSLGIELTNNCNLHCPECFSGSGLMKRDKGYMKIELFEKIINELTPYLYNINLYFQGEPMLHPLFFSFIEKSRKIHTVASTNGHYLSVENSEQIVRSGLSKLIISLDGMDQETYSSYRINGNLDDVVNGIKNVTEARNKYGSSVKIELQLLVNRFNEHQIPAIKEFARRIKVPLNLKSMQIINADNIASWLPSGAKFRRYSLMDGKYIPKNRLPDNCARLWFNPVITWDGKVVPCCFDKDAEHVMGDMTLDSFREIWNGPKYRIFRKSILTGRHMIRICRNCTSGLRGVKY